MGTCGQEDTVSALQFSFATLLSLRPGASGDLSSITTITWTLPPPCLQELSAPLTLGWAHWWAPKDGASKQAANEEDIEPFH
jgi:hypothetical protein